MINLQATDPRARQYYTTVGAVRYSGGSVGAPTAPRAGGVLTHAALQGNNSNLAQKLNLIMTSAQQYRKAAEDTGTATAGDGGSRTITSAGLGLGLAGSVRSSATLNATTATTTTSLSAGSGNPSFAYAPAPVGYTYSAASPTGQLKKVSASTQAQRTRHAVTHSALPSTSNTPFFSRQETGGFSSYFNNNYNRPEILPSTTSSTATTLDMRLSQLSTSVGDSNYGFDTIVLPPPTKSASELGGNAVQPRGHSEAIAGNPHYALSSMTDDYHDRGAIQQEGRGGGSRSQHQFQHFQGSGVISSVERMKVAAEAAVKLTSGRKPHKRHHKRQKDAIARLMLDASSTRPPPAPTVSKQAANASNNNSDNNSSAFPGASEHAGDGAKQGFPDKSTDVGDRNRSSNGDDTRQLHESNIKKKGLSFYPLTGHLVRDSSQGAESASLGSHSQRVRVRKSNSNLDKLGRSSAPRGSGSSRGNEVDTGVLEPFMAYLGQPHVGKTGHAGKSGQSPSKSAAQYHRRAAGPPTVDLAAAAAADTNGGGSVSKHLTVATHDATSSLSPDNNSSNTYSNNNNSDQRPGTHRDHHHHPRTPRHPDLVKRRGANANSESDFQAQSYFGGVSVVGPLSMMSRHHHHNGGYYSHQQHAGTAGSWSYCNGAGGGGGAAVVVQREPSTVALRSADQSSAAAEGSATNNTGSSGRGSATATAASFLSLSAKRSSPSGTQALPLSGKRSRGSSSEKNSFSHFVFGHGPSPLQGSGGKQSHSAQPASSRRDAEADGRSSTANWPSKTSQTIRHSYRASGLSSNELKEVISPGTEGMRGRRGGSKGFSGKTGSAYDGSWISEDRGLLQQASSGSYANPFAMARGAPRTTDFKGGERVFFASPNKKKFKNEETGTKRRTEDETSTKVADPVTGETARIIRVAAAIEAFGREVGRAIPLDPEGRSPVLVEGRQKSATGHLSGNKARSAPVVSQISASSSSENGTENDLSPPSVLSGRKGDKKRGVWVDENLLRTILKKINALNAHLVQANSRYRYKRTYGESDLESSESEGRVGDVRSSQRGKAKEKPRRNAEGESFDTSQRSKVLRGVSRTDPESALRGSKLQSRGDMLAHHDRGKRRKAANAKSREEMQRSYSQETMTRQGTGGGVRITLEEALDAQCARQRSAAPEVMRRRAIRAAKARKRGLDRQAEIKGTSGGEVSAGRYDPYTPRKPELTLSGGERSRSHLQSNSHRSDQRLPPSGPHVPSASSPSARCYEAPTFSAATTATGGLKGQALTTPARRQARQETKEVMRDSYVDLGEGRSSHEPFESPHSDLVRKRSELGRSRRHVSDSLSPASAPPGGTIVGSSADARRSEQSSSYQQLADQVPSFTSGGSRLGNSLGRRNDALYSIDEEVRDSSQKGVRARRFFVESPRRISAGTKTSDSKRQGRTTRKAELPARAVSVNSATAVAKRSQRLSRTTLQSVVVTTKDSAAAAEVLGGEAHVAYAPLKAEKSGMAGQRPDDAEDTNDDGSMAEFALTAQRRPRSRSVDHQTGWESYDVDGASAGVLQDTPEQSGAMHAFVRGDHMRHLSAFQTSSLASVGDRDEPALLSGRCSPLALKSGALAVGGPAGNPLVRRSRTGYPAPPRLLKNRKSALVGVSPAFPRSSALRSSPQVKPGGKPRRVKFEEHGDDGEWDGEEETKQQNDSASPVSFSSSEHLGTSGLQAPIWADMAYVSDTPRPQGLPENTPEAPEGFSTARGVTFAEKPIVEVRQIGGGAVGRLDAPSRRRSSSDEDPPPYMTLEAIQNANQAPLKLVENDALKSLISRGRTPSCAEGSRAGIAGALVAQSRGMMASSDSSAVSVAVPLHTGVSSHKEGLVGEASGQQAEQTSTSGGGGGGKAQTQDPRFSRVMHVHTHSLQIESFGRSIADGDRQSREVQIIKIYKEPSIYVMTDFVTSEEADLLSLCCENGWTRCLVPSPVPTSSTELTVADLPLHLSPLIERLEKRIAAALQVPGTFMLSMLAFKVTALDNFHESRQISVPRGATKALFVYLNDVNEGGETDFDELGFQVRPQKGTAIMFGDFREAENSGDTAEESTSQSNYSLKAVHYREMPPKAGVKTLVKCWAQDPRVVQQVVSAAESAMAFAGNNNARVLDHNGAETDYGQLVTAGGNATALTRGSQQRRFLQRMTTAPTQPTPTRLSPTELLLQANMLPQMGLGMGMLGSAQMRAFGHSAGQFGFHDPRLDLVGLGQMLPGSGHQQSAFQQQQQQQQQQLLQLQQLQQQLQSMGGLERLQQQLRQSQAQLVVPPKDNDDDDAEGKSPPKTTPTTTAVAGSLAVMSPSAGTAVSHDAPQATLEGGADSPEAVPSGTEQTRVQDSTADKVESEIHITEATHPAGAIVRRKCGEAPAAGQLDGGAQGGNAIEAKRLQEGTNTVSGVEALCAPLTMPNLAEDFFESEEVTSAASGSPAIAAVPGEPCLNTQLA